MESLWFTCFTAGAVFSAAGDVFPAVAGSLVAEGLSVVSGTVPSTGIERESFFTAVLSALCLVPGGKMVICLGKSGFSGEIGHMHIYNNDIICHCGIHVVRAVRSRSSVAKEEAGVVLYLQRLILRHTTRYIISILGR